MSNEKETVFSSSSSLTNLPLTEIQRAVPVIAIFTKFDDLIKQIYDGSLTMAQNRQVALGLLKAKFQAPLSKFNFPPKAYVRVEGVFNVLFSGRVWNCLPN
jgi:hypothetical protein